MNIKLLTEHHLEFQSFKGGCTGSSESSLVKTPHCWKSLVVAQSSRFVSDVAYVHMGQYQLLSVLSARLSPLNIDHSRNLPVEICGINYTEKYTNL